MFYIQAVCRFESRQCRDSDTDSVHSHMQWSAVLTEYLQIASESRHLWVEELRWNVDAVVTAVPLVTGSRNIAGTERKFWGQMRMASRREQRNTMSLDDSLPHEQR